MHINLADLRCICKPLTPPVGTIRAIIHKCGRCIAPIRRSQKFLATVPLNDDLEVAGKFVTERTIVQTYSQFPTQNLDMKCCDIHCLFRWWIY